MDAPNAHADEDEDETLLHSFEKVSLSSPVLDLTPSTLTT